MSLKDLYYMKIALKEALIAFNKNEVPIGAIIIYKNEIIAKTHNLTETLQNITAHAEILAINEASNYLGKKYMNDCTLYVTLEPCIMCTGALFWSKIDKIVFGTYNKSKNNISIKLHPSTKLISGVMKKECKFIIENFFYFKRNKKYKVIE